jgi:hypothetical protein
MLPSVMDLVEILKRPEGKALEFKRDLSSPDGALKTIVAFVARLAADAVTGAELRPRVEAQPFVGDEAFALLHG